MLDTFWRVLISFEEIALGGHLLRDATISTPRGRIEQPCPWMLHIATEAITAVICHSDAVALPLAGAAAEFAATIQPAHHCLDEPNHASA